MNKYVDYYKYIESDEWRKISEAMKWLADNKCQLCNASRDNASLHTHHKTYDRLGNERPEDLIVLCENCHKKFHDIPDNIKQQKEIGIMEKLSKYRDWQKKLNVILRKDSDTSRNYLHLHRLIGIIESYYDIRNGNDTEASIYLDNKTFIKDTKTYLCGSLLDRFDRMGLKEYEVIVHNCNIPIEYFKKEY